MKNFEYWETLSYSADFAIENPNLEFFGFNNNINPIKIGNINNLSICSRWANRKKQIMNEEKFIEYLKENNFINKK